MDGHLNDPPVLGGIYLSDSGLHSIVVAMSGTSECVIFLADAAPWEHFSSGHEEVGLSGDTYRIAFLPLLTYRSKLGARVDQMSTDTTMKLQERVFEEVEDGDEFEELDP